MTILIFLATLFGSMLIGVPVAFSLLLSGIALMATLNMFDPMIVAQNTINGANSFPLLAVPFFMLAGEVMNAGGLSQRIVNLAVSILGHKKGGLGYVGIVASVILASLSGSAVADTAALGALLLPMMMESGYSKHRSAGLITSSSLTAPIIPPSISFIIFGVVANVSIGELFLAGIAPGLLLATSVTICWFFMTRNNDYELPEKKSRSQKLVALKESLWALMLPLIIIFGLKLGIFTPTEAAVAAAVYSIFISLFIYKEINIIGLYYATLAAAKTTAMVMFLIAAASVSAWMITIAGIPDKAVQMLSPLTGTPTILMLCIALILLLIGTTMDVAPTILVMAPILMPVVKMAGIDPVYFGVIFVVCVTIGLATPPIGAVLNVMAGVSGMKIEKVALGIFPFLIVQLTMLILMIIFPELIMVPEKFLNG